MHTIFAYGILIKSGVRKNLGIKLDYLEDATLDGFLKESYDGDLRFDQYDPEKHYEPLWVVCPREGESVNGQLLVTDDAGLKRLDDLEGHPHFYERVTAQIGGRTCFVYQKGKGRG